MADAHFYEPHTKGVCLVLPWLCLSLEKTIIANNNDVKGERRFLSYTACGCVSSRYVMKEHTEIATHR